MKKSFIFLAISCFSIGLTLSGCSSGNSINSGGSGAPGGGSTGSSGNSILHGQYAFSFTGSVTDTGYPVFEEGSFTADGAGNIMAGVEDINIVGTGISTGTSVTGTYSIGSDGRGTLTFSSLGQQYKIVVENGNHGQLIRFDSGAAGSGTFDLQPSTFSLSALHQGNYVFEWNGADPGFNPYSAIGNIGLSGTGATGAIDLNDGGNYGQSAVIFTLGTPDGNGHGTASIVFGPTNAPTTYTFDYIVVSANRVLLIETDSKAGTVGEADAQSSGTLTPSGSYAVSVNGINQEYALVGQIVVGAGGVIISSDAVQNVQFSSVNGTYPGTFTASDSVSGVTVNDRFAFSVTEPTGLYTDNFVAYMVSPTQAMIMETDSDQLTFGQMLSQTGASFTSASLTGNYGLNITGLDPQAVEGDFVGQFTSGANATLTSGTIDINDEDLLPTTIPNSIISGGNYTVVNATTGHGTLSFTSAGGAFAFNFYFVSPNQIFVVETDNLFVGLGSALSQPAIP